MKSSILSIVLAVLCLISGLLRWYTQGYLHWSQILLYSVGTVAFIVMAIVDKKKNHKEWQKWWNRNNKTEDSE